MILFIATASASPGSAGAIHLGAQPLPTGTQFAGVAGGFAWAPSGGAAVPVVEVGTALGDRAALIAMAGVTVPVESVPALVSGRWLAVDAPELRLAVTLSATVLPELRSDPRRVSMHLSPGLALEAGPEKLRFDLAVPFWGLSSYNQYFGVEHYPVPMLSSIGVSGRLGEHQRLRFGLPEFLSWSYRGERAYVDIGGGTLVLVGFLWVKAGVLF